MKNKIVLGHFIFAIILVMILGTGCNKKLLPESTSPQDSTRAVTNISPTTTQVNPSPTVDLPIPTAKSLTVMQPYDYLLTVAELPMELFKSNTFVFIEPDGSISSLITFFNVGVGRITNSITIAAQPYGEVPDISDWAGMQIEDPIIGQNSKAFSGDTQITYIFIKGNSLVRIFGALPLEEMVNLGKIIEARLPDSLEFSPISFPEQLDTTSFHKFFNSLSLAKQNPGSDDLISTDIFSETDYYCLSYEAIDPNQKFDIAIYEPQEKVYVQKFIPEFSVHCNPFLGISHAGLYELRISINDTLVAILPFEIQ